MSTPPTDSDAIAASVRDPRAFVGVFERHFREIHRYLARRVGAQLADDLAAEVFAEAFRVRAGYVLHHPARVASGIACGNEPRIWPSDMAIIDPADGDAVGACAKLWRKGVLSGGTPQAQVPPLTPCVAATGAVVVLPSAEPALCAKLGAKELPPGDRAARARFAALRTALMARLGDCVAGDARTRAVIRAELDRRGYADWRVASEPGAAGGCGSLAFSEDERTVYAVPR